MHPRFSLRLPVSMLLMALGTGFSAGIASAVPQCGNRVCDKPQEDCANCTQDCGVCAKCGDGKCTKGKETCFRCPEDCGECPTVMQEPVCGDAICEGAEDCGVCTQDCGVCPVGDESFSDRWSRLLLHRGFNEVRRVTRAVRRYARRLAAGLEESALRRTEAAGELLAFLEKHPDIASRFTAVDRRLIGRVSNREKVTVLNIVPSARITFSLRRAVRKEARGMTELMRNMLDDPNVQERLSSLPEYDALAVAVDAGDLEAAAGILPSPSRSLSALREELDALGSILTDSGRGNATLSLLAIAFAQGTQESGKETFARAIRLGQGMRRIAQNPDAVLPSLQERLAYLQNRGNAIAGIVNLSGEEVSDRLAQIGRNAGSSSPGTLVKLLGIARFIRESPNFRTLETRYADAIGQIRSGWRGLRARLAPPRSTQEEAATLLKEKWGSAAAAELTEGDLAQQRQTVLNGIRSDRLRIVTFIMEKASPPKRLSLQKRLGDAEAAIAKAKTRGELHEAMGEYGDLLFDVQDASRESGNAFLRLVYFLQDFFHADS